MLITVTGKVAYDSGIVEVGKNGFQKRTVIIETDMQYRPFIPVDLTRDQLETDIPLGASVVADCHVNGSDLVGGKRAFVNLAVTRISRVDDNVTGKENPTEAPQSDEVPF